VQLSNIPNIPGNKQKQAAVPYAAKLCHCGSHYKHECKRANGLEEPEEQEDGENETGCSEKGGMSTSKGDASKSAQKMLPPGAMSA
jgi:hypothetical protein